MNLMRRNTMALFAAGTLMAGAMAAARQQPGMSAPGQQAPPGQTMPNYPAAAPADQDNPQTFMDKSFLRQTMEADDAQVQMGQLAAEKSASADVKHFGQKMAQIHEQLTNQIKPVADKLNVGEPKGPSKKDKKEIENLQALTGAGFDAAFLRAMLKTQQSELKLFQDEAQSAADPSLQQLAKMDEPVLTQHLQILQQIAQHHNVTVENDK